MFLKQHKLLVIALSALVLVAVALAVSLGRNSQAYGHISLYVIDAYTLAPLKNATIVIPECGVTGTTDARGVALISSVPLDMDSEFIRLTGASYGEVTLIIYAEGYLPCVWLKVHMQPSRIRNGPTVYMFPEGSEQYSVIVFSESPDDALMRDFVERYTPSR